MKLTLKIWRQKDAQSIGHLATYEIDNVVPEMSLLEMLDTLNEQLTLAGTEPVAIEHDCREGICGACCLVINGVAHGPGQAATTCQVYMRQFHDGETIYIEPFRAKAFPVIRDLMVDRGAFDRITAAGGFVSVNTGGAQDGNAIPIPKVDAEAAMDAAQCIGCGACVAACKNASAMLFVGAKITHLAKLPQGQGERVRRARAMTMAMQAEGFGNCTNQLECEAVCPKEISVKHIATLNREFFRAAVSSEA